MRRVKTQLPLKNGQQARIPIPNDCMKLYFCNIICRDEIVAKSISGFRIEFIQQGLLMGYVRYNKDERTQAEPIEESDILNPHVYFVDGIPNKIHELVFTNTLPIYAKLVLPIPLAQLNTYKDAIFYPDRFLPD